MKNREQAFYFINCQRALVYNCNHCKYQMKFMWNQEELKLNKLNYLEKSGKMARVHCFMNYLVFPFYNQLATISTS